MLIEKVGKDGKNGFVGADRDREIDGSGIDYDRTAKNRFSIVSKEGRRLFHYDWDSR